MEGTAVFREGTTGNIVLDSVTSRPLRSWMKPTQLAQGTGLHPWKFVLGPLVLSKRPAVFTSSQNCLFVHYCAIFQMHDYSYNIYQLWYKKSHWCCGARGAVGGLVPCSSAPQSWYWRWRKRCTFTPPTNNPCQRETRTHTLSNTSPTL